jgi:dihydrofolate reductase
MSKVIVIAAITVNYAIGKNNDLVVKIKKDMEHFVEETSGPDKIIIAGKLTYESFPVRPLPNREANIVVTRNTTYPIVDGMFTAPSLEEAVKMAYVTATGDIYIIGGGVIYKQALESKDMVDELIITHIDKVVEDADVFFPAIDPSIWVEVERSETYSTLKGTEYYFARYIRK